MTEIKKDKNTTIRIHGYEFEVSAKKAAEFHKLQRRIRYLEINVKQERLDKQHGCLLPSKEDSLDRLQGLGVEFSAQQLSIEDVVDNHLMKEKLYECLQQLSKDEQMLIFQLYFLGKTERQYAKEKSIHYMTIHSKKKLILGKLLKMLQT